MSMMPAGERDVSARTAPRYARDDGVCGRRVVDNSGCLLAGRLLTLPSPLTGERVREGRETQPLRRGEQALSRTFPI